MTDNATLVSFLVPNFEAPDGVRCVTADAQRTPPELRLTGDGWSLTLFEVGGRQGHWKKLVENSGYAVTHVGRLTREDGGEFSLQSAVELIDTFRWFASFACGRWTTPLLPSGYASDGRLAWQRWSAGRTEPYRDRVSWLDPFLRDALAGAFPGYLRRWRDENWHDAMRLATHWYVEANAQAGSVEGSIGLTQYAFELLSSVVLVENERWLSADACKGLPAADKTRLLLKWAGIPTDIPAVLVDLVAAAKEFNWPDGSAALAEVRNVITHPTRKNRNRFGKHPPTMWFDVWRLGLWYLELTILRISDYRGYYANRLTRKFTGQTELVPWAASG